MGGILHQVTFYYLTPETHQTACYPLYRGINRLPEKYIKEDKAKINSILKLTCKGFCGNCVPATYASYLPLPLPLPHIA
jgi:hypothetical protein